jgi:farnesyl diphosphate synthase
LAELASSAPVLDAMAATAAQVEAVLDALLPRSDGPEGRLYQAMRYGTLGGGKRLRPYLVVAGGALCGAEPGSCLRIAAAVEMVHSYSLIHDDLPAMDDDDLRRGRPSCHIAFDEATAILAGDALLTLAFGVLGEAATHPSGEIRAELVRALAAAAGGSGMVGGQMIDLYAEAHDVDAALIARLEQMKTGALIAFSCEAGAIAAAADDETRHRLRAFGVDLGLAFQVRDDLLDVEGDEAALGKKVGKDAGAGKATFVAMLGADGARREAKRLIERASARLDGFGPRAAALRDVAGFVLSRRW